MCRLMMLDGAQPDKVWIKGALHPTSTNTPTCVVGWGWHVAPTLQVNTSSGVETWVIDPSLFDGPVPQATWKDIQLDPNAVLQASPASTFYYGTFIGFGGDSTDTNYVQTNQVLSDYRTKLRLRSVGPDGPPPYIACMTKPWGVQWYGSLAANQTQTWFTWGWGAAWKVLWTMMPLTLCPGAAQLKWNVRVERANATQCTYWISVTNLTGDPVKFEGRFDVLSWV
jgi:hypothetical protein